MNTAILTNDVPSLFPFMETVLQDGGRKHYTIDGTVTTFNNQYGYSGFNYEENDLRGQLAFGIILGGTGYVLRRIITSNGEQVERNDYFNLNGEVTFTADREALKPLFTDGLPMDLSCPILDHLYNFLGQEYKLAAEAKSNTPQVHSVEKLLHSFYKSKNVRLPIQDRANDLAFENIYNKMLTTEMDPVLTWEERQMVIKGHHETLDRILDTKIRAHKLNSVLFKAALLRKGLGNFSTRVISRPMSNAMGILFKYTIGKILWFFSTVKNNLGYSVALAVYGPFTYYFITMPMNPHAMQAVGRVRAVYLQVKQDISDVANLGSVAVNDMKSKPAIAVTTSDTVSTTAAAPVKTEVSAMATAPAMSNIIYQSAVTSKNEPVMISVGEGKKENAAPSILNMLLATDVPAANNQTWVERMSSFKQMQIGYEENIEYASRMGRLEQLETQYNFPMQIEQTWGELERYNDMIFKLRAENPNMSAKMKQYLFNEVNRTQQLELYLWDRLGRFILDQVYVMLDQDKEQKRNDYYVGRAFVLMQEMTQTLSWRYKDFKKPEGYERIDKLADFYKNSRKEFGSVTKNLAANSDLFKQKDLYSTTEFRTYMKRQWEILFLQNSKAEEASNMGLNMYIWSVRNTVWILQSIYSTKRDELALLMKRDTTGQLFTPDEMMVKTRASMQYETLFHNLVLEYVGIREEIMNRLGKDIESAQRKVVIENLREFLSDRDKLDGLPVAAKNDNVKTKAGATL
ncbi:MAG TPA: hypothetical protein VNJ08_14075 [Bacteriovoracaceae bacterium]|nr:hypothetical protein [Bacteriovoracaceae bacterium]